MTVLAFVMVPLLLIPLIHPLHGTVDLSFDAADDAIWALFVVEYGIRLFLAPHRWNYVRQPAQLFDLAIVALPFLRPLRILRSARALQGLRASRLFAYIGSGTQHVREILKRRGLSYVLLVAVVVVFVSAGLVTAFEAHARGATIHNFGDGLWWAIATVTTVGYGDKVPVTGAGRAVAIALMLVGVAIFGVVTASVAAYFVETGDKDHDPRIDEVQAALDRIERHLGISPAQTLRAVDDEPEDPAFSR